MGTRPLRQYYDEVSVVIDDDLGRALVDPWARHRRRLVDHLGTLSEEQWRVTTRCTEWDARGVIGHLVTVDNFWMLSMANAQSGAAPTTLIRGFDPSTGTDTFVAPLLELPVAELYGQFVSGTDTFVGLVDGFGADDWGARGEAPFGHLACRLLLAHAHWDSWLHERDILEPLGLAPPVEHDDLLIATWYTLVVAALQGGLVGDATPVGPGPDGPIEVVLRFDDLPDDPLRVAIGTGVVVERAPDGADAVPAGSALDFVETFAGRKSNYSFDALPPAFAAQLTRASQIL